MVGYGVVNRQGYAVCIRLLRQNFNSPRMYTEVLAGRP